MVVLPAPDGPTSATVAPAGTCEIDIRQRGDAAGRDR